MEGQLDAVSVNMVNIFRGLTSSERTLIMKHGSIKGFLASSPLFDVQGNIVRLRQVKFYIVYVGIVIVLIVSV